MTDSLFAISIFLLNLSIFKVGCNPEIPGIAETVTSNLSFFLILKSFKIFVFLKYFFFNFSKIYLFLIIKNLGLYLLI